MTTATLDMPAKPKPATNPSPAGRAVSGRPVPKPDTLDRIVLTGFMGSGKSTAGAVLAERLGWRFLDLDHEIEARDGRSVPQIFAEHGEPHFRHIESATLASLLGERRVVPAQEASPTAGVPAPVLAPCVKAQSIQRDSHPPPRLAPVAPVSW